MRPSLRERRARTGGAKSTHRQERSNRGAASGNLMTFIMYGSIPFLVKRPCIDTAERRKVGEALDLHNGHIGKAATSLGMHGTTLQRKIRSLGIHLQRTALYH